MTPSRSDSTSIGDATPMRFAVSSYRVLSEPMEMNPSGPG